jgi:hypothetical protein
MEGFFWYLSYKGYVFATGCPAASACEHYLDITTSLSAVDAAPA